jgi:hypothetical protein
MYSSLVDEKDLISLTRIACDDIEKISKCENTISPSGYHSDPVQTLVMRRGANKDYIITPIIEASAIQAEIKAAGAGETFLRIFPAGIKDDISKRSIGLRSDDEWNQILKNIEISSIPCRKSDIEVIFKSGGDVYRRITRESFDLLRCEDSISVKKSPSQKTEIKRESGYIFEGLSVDHRFLSRGTWDRKNVKVALLDGVIENVSEIHRFIEEAANKKTPCVIFSIDALPDVSETLIKNFELRNLDVILVKIPVTHDHINTLVDLGIVFEEQPVAASTGDSISIGISRQKCFADRITITRGKVLIEKEDSKRSVESHVRDLRKRIEENIETSIILEPRVSRLSNSTVRIFVGIDDQKRDPNIVEKLDRTFRSLPKILRSGFIEKNDFQEFSSEKIDLLFGVNHEISAEMAAQSIKIFLSAREAIKSAAAGIRKI